MRAKLFLLLLPLLIVAKEISIEWLRDKPSGTVKDYYLWRFLNQKIAPAQADEAFYMVERVTRKIFYSYAAKSDRPEIKEAARCLRHKPDFKTTSSSCIATWLTPYRFMSLSPLEKDYVINRLTPFEKLHRYYLLLKGPYIYEKLITRPKEFIKTFNSVSDRIREETFNQTLPKELVDSLKNLKGFKSFVNIAVTNPKLKKLHFSFFEIDPKNLDHKTSFLLAMNAIRYKKYETAKKFLERSLKSSYYRFDIDKAAFWLYRLGEKSHLHNLCSSWDINIYTLLAEKECNQKIVIEKLNEGLYLVRSSKQPPPTFTAKLKKEDIDFNTEDPFLWSKILNEISEKKRLKEWLNRLRHEKTLPFYAFLLERDLKYKNHPFITPYEKLLEKNDEKTKALIYAIARQESRFIPPSVSRSFALGPMQFMPFLAKAIAKDKGLSPFDLDMMFDPQTAVDFAKTHLKFLNKKLLHPMLIAYAYNGGIGFTKREVIRSGIFKQGPHQPYLGMELVSYPESRKYAKKVLANYIVYLRILNKEGSALKELKKLESFDRNHRF